MSIVLAAAAGGMALWYFADSDTTESDQRPQEEDMTQVAQRYNSTGTYNDAADLALILNKPGYVLSVRHGQDLTGVPCRWIELPNKAVYKTYDMDTPYL